MKCAGYVSDDAIVCEFALEAYGQLSKIIDLVLQLHVVLKKGGAKDSKVFLVTHSTPPK